jgi:hypothetical protein
MAHRDKRRQLGLASGFGGTADVHWREVLTEDGAYDPERTSTGRAQAVVRP